MKVLLLGGTGTISSAVSQAAISHGWETYVLNRGNRPGAMVEGVELLKCDINNQEKVRSLIKGQIFDVVVDFIAFTQPDIERDYRLFGDTTNQFILISTAAVYDKRTNRPFITESTPASNTGWQYASDKIHCEKFLFDKYSNEGFPITIVRPSQIYDKASVPVSVPSNSGFYPTINRIKQGKKIIVHGDGTALWTPTFSSDFAEGFMGLLGNPHAIGEVYHITSDENLTWNQITEALAVALGYEVEIVHVASDTLVKMRPDLEGRLLFDSAHCNIFDNTKIKKQCLDTSQKYVSIKVCVLRWTILKRTHIPTNRILTLTGGAMKSSKNMGKQVLYICALGEPMNIAKIETFIVKQKLEQPFYFSQWEYNTRQVCLVKVTDQDGVYGWGEGYGPAGVVQAGIQFFEPLILGQDPLHVETLWQSMYRRSFDYARRGVLLASLSAIDIALWDLRGKILNQPVSILLGGRRRENIKVYATGMYFVEGADLEVTLADEARMYADQGYKAIKMKVGLGVKEDLKYIQAVRRAIGPDIQLMVDSNHAYSRSEALSLVRKIEPLDITFFEEPLSPEDYEGYRELRIRTEIPIAAGECEYLTAGFRHLVEGHCVDIAQPDICAAGGLTEVKKIVALANTFGVNVIPHCWGTGIAFAAGLHLVSTLDVVPGRLRMPEPMLEMDRTENPLRDQLTLPKFEAVDGMVPVPTEPGLGIDVDPDLLEEFIN